ncbi:hypothetical protein [Halocynthiibacter styelae]|uniref:Uncharacterized protein n=1 Tax=Halocynthiibacter styelae TaxID=2761955 RepID=A0A8J7II92_9RHOB|nr:hypothetical protein [Paenihalocynthiibacter styelae]MBI1492938.1 hypothetical protein [Paenihalocynthiibacter styelae]
MQATETIVNMDSYISTRPAKEERMQTAAQILEDLAYDLAGNMRPDQTGQLITFARELMVLSREVQSH